MGMEASRIQAMIRSCGHTRDLVLARRLHAWLIDHQHHPQHRFLSNLLMESYGKCGRPDDSAALFSTLPRPNLFSWTILLTVFAQNGNLLEAQQVFSSMPRRDIVTWNSILAACTTTSCLAQAEKIHAAMPQWNASSWNALITANAAAGHVYRAASLLDAMDHPDAITWTVMMGVYAQEGNTELAAAVFQDRIPCGRDMVAWITLVLAYTTVGQVDRAAQTFRGMPQHDQVAGNVMLHGYCAAGRMTDALQLFHNAMVTHDTVSWNILLHGHARLAQLEDARRVFDATPHKNAASWSGMVTAYGCAGRVDTAWCVFNAMPRGTRTVIAWNSMLGLVADATFHYLCNRMPAWDTTTWNITVAVFFSAGHLHRENAQAGNLQQAENILSLCPALSTNTWNGLIAGYARHGYVDAAFHRFHKMLLCGIPPDNITFVCLLVSCSHAGLTAAACRVFHSMQRDWDITPTADHYGCVVDTVARSGQLAVTQELVNSVIDNTLSTSSSSYRDCSNHQSLVLTSQLELASLHGNISTF